MDPLDDIDADLPAALSLTVPPESAGLRLDRALAAALPELSRSRLQALIRAGAVTLDPDDGGGTLADPSRPVKPGWRLTVLVPEPEDGPAQPEPMGLDVVYEDDHLIVVDKPAGLVVHPAPGNPDGTLVNGLLHHCRGRLSGIGGVRRPGIVHRLDKDTSGLIVVAKSDAAHRGLAEQFAAHEVARAYRAVVWGVPAREGTIDAPIGRDPRARKRMAVVGRGGKPARTSYRVEAAYAMVAALVSCRLATGRTHQIRVHMAHIGHPLLGDPLYGRPPRGARADAPTGRARAAAQALGRQALHAALIGFHHPVAGDWLQFETNDPKDFRSLLNILENFQ